MGAMYTPMSLAATIVIAVVTFTIGILIGHFAMPRSPHKSEIERTKMMDHITALRYSAGDEITKKIIREIRAENIRKHSKFLSEEPRLAGTPRDEQLAEHIRQLWLDQGLDRAELASYRVLLSYPDPGQPNKVFITDGENRIPVSQDKEVQDGGKPDFQYLTANRTIPAYHGYAPSGNVQGDPVYVNYARLEDFELLESKYGIDVGGKICIARYGKIFRGNKVKNAADRGAVGMIIYSDPEQVAAAGTGDKDVYPHTWWMPGSAMQRGYVFIGQGDPLTPGYPAVDGAYRYAIEDVDMPSIPSQPIGYKDAEKIFREMGGLEAPVEWKGRLNVTYRLGTEFQEPHKKLQLITHNQYRNKTVSNVIGIIEGDVEADRYVVIGNHRDSWGLGAMDAVTGTAPLLELTRVLGKLRKGGWRPRRTLVFCSWTAEEFALTGSTEWVLEHVHELTTRAVASINVDTCVSGPMFEPDASPSLMATVRDAAKQVPDPVHPSKSVFQKWREQQNTTQEPRMDTLQSGTDHAAFAFYAGVPSVNLEWTYDKTKFPGLSSYPAYHTGFETFHLVDKFIDPGFAVHQSCARLAGVLLHQMADSTLLPYNFNELASRMVAAFKQLAGKEGKRLEKEGVDLDGIQMALNNFTTAAQEWHKRISAMDMKNPLLVRQINDQMMSLERVFVKPEGLPGRNMIRHAVFSPSESNQYSQGAFPAVSDLLYGLNKLSEDEKRARWKQIRRHISDLMIMIQMAASFLKTPADL